VLKNKDLVLLQHFPTLDIVKLVAKTQKENLFVIAVLVIMSKILLEDVVLISNIMM